MHGSVEHDRPPMNQGLSALKVELRELVARSFRHGHHLMALEHKAAPHIPAIVICSWSRTVPHTAGPSWGITSPLFCPRHSAVPTAFEKGKFSDEFEASRLFLRRSPKLYVSVCT